MSKSTFILFLMLTQYLIPCFTSSNKVPDYYSPPEEWYDDKTVIAIIAFSIFIFMCCFPDMFPIFVLTIIIGTCIKYSRIGWDENRGEIWLKIK